jgi:16S rRNA (guanine1207-N2)-methyltransferase
VQGGEKMSEHYYSSNPTTESNPQTWTYQLRGNEFTFTSDNGVFSKNEVDFGTRMLIESFEMPNIEGKVLDVGCGYGPIGLAVAKENPDRQVIMVDVNERAVELSKLNAKQNGISNVSVYQSNIFEAIENEKFAVILSNPPIRAGKKVVHQIFEQSFDHLHSQGELWLVIQKKQGAPSAIEKLKSIFSEVDVVTKKKGYFIIKAKKH